MCTCLVLFGLFHANRTLFHACLVFNLALPPGLWLAVRLSCTQRTAAWPVAGWPAAKHGRQPPLNVCARRAEVRRQPLSSAPPHLHVLPSHNQLLCIPHTGRPHRAHRAHLSPWPLHTLPLHILPLHILPLRILPLHTLPLHSPQHGHRSPATRAKSVRPKDTSTTTTTTSSNPTLTPSVGAVAAMSPPLRVLRPAPGATPRLTCRGSCPKCRAPRAARALKARLQRILPCSPP